MKFKAAGSFPCKQLMPAVKLIASAHMRCYYYLNNNQYRNIRFAQIKHALIKSYHLRVSNTILLWFGKLTQWNHHVNGTNFQIGLSFKPVKVHFRSHVNVLIVTQKLFRHFFSCDLKNVTGDGHVSCFNGKYKVHSFFIVSMLST